ncbi:uncharacterized protein LOC122043701 [Zingiber officinale]|uniref:uncharacterized protein LOC122043701 n=1 Tax=Zingiber officinale TaxID=94328 RepID=UPI001C4C2CAE|nr:uncharacterized protein LOC122043701 [Zingiber officinale]
MQLAIRLNFRATNNEVEYEALLAGLQAAWHVSTAWVVIYSDSQQIAQQVAGNFEANSDKLQLNREAYEKMKESFKEVIVTKIPRVDNPKLPNSTDRLTEQYRRVDQLESPNDHLSSARRSTC